MTKGLIDETTEHMTGESSWPQGKWGGGGSKVRTLRYEWREGFQPSCSAGYTLTSWSVPWESGLKTRIFLALMRI